MIRTTQRQRIETFETYLEATENPIAAAMLCLAESIEDIAAEFHDFDHQLAIGIRKGVFGADASSNESISDITAISEI